MRLLTRVRISAGVWLTPLVVLVFMANLAAQESSGEGYRLAVATHDSFNLLLASGICALGGAWEGNRLRRAGILKWPHGRSTARILTAPWLMSVLPATVLAVCVFGRHSALAGGMPTVVAATTVLSLWVWGLTGIAVGLWLPPAVSLPVAFAVPVLWLILAPASSVLWVRHLTGSWDSCCAVDQTLAPQAIFGTAAVLSGLAAAAAIAIWARNRAGARPWRVLTLSGAVIVLLAGLVAGGLQVHHLGAEPVAPRHAHVSCAQGRNVRICLLPEHQSESRHVVALADRATSRWQDYRVRTPSTLTEAPRSLPTRTVAPLMVNSVYDTDLDVLQQLTEALTAAPCQNSDQAPVDVIVRQQRAQAWLVQTSGVDVGGKFGAARFGLDQKAWDWATALRARPADRQGSQINADMGFLAACR